MLPHEHFSINITLQGTKKTSRLGRAMKNLVTNDEKEKMKEELAWQVNSNSPELR